MENLRRSDVFHSQSTFPRFMELPKEIRQEIYGLAVEPRVVPLNFKSAHRTSLKIDLPLPPLIQVCHESRMEVLRTHYLMSEPPYLAICPKDTLLWICYQEPEAFSEDAQALQCSDLLQHIHHLVMSEPIWNSIAADPNYSKLFCAIRMAENLETLSIATDAYSSIRWSEMAGKTIRFLEDEQWPEALRSWDSTTGTSGHKSNDDVWEAYRGWDAGRTFPKSRLPDVRFVTVIFEDTEGL